MLLSNLCYSVTVSHTIGAVPNEVWIMFFELAYSEEKANDRESSVVSYNCVHFVAYYTHTL